PSGRTDHTAVWTGTRMVVWGGRELDYGTYDWVLFDSGGRYDPENDVWTATSLDEAPSARALHTATWTGRVMIVWSGGDGFGGDTNTGGRYDPVSDRWTPTSLVNAPPARSDHTAVWTGAEVVAWGGFSYYRPASTGGRYNPTTNTWMATTTT